METLQNLPEFKDITVNGQDFKIHADVYKTGGIKIIDEGNVFPPALKEAAGKIAAKVMKGELGDIMKVATPAQIHNPGSHLTLKMNESSLVNYLTTAAQVADPVERLKTAIPYFVCGLFISPTII